MTRRHVALAALTLWCLAFAQPAASEESGWVTQENEGAGSGTVRCESERDSRRHCAVDNIIPGSVRMQRQLSQTACRRGANWDADSSGIWVDKGCRAEFAYSHRFAHSGSSSSRPGGLGRVQCESRDNQRKHCSVPNIDPASVTMESKLSHDNCYRGENWDADSSGIWVDKGCRAVFNYVSRNGGFAGGGGASVASMRQACIERASREWAVTESNLEITHSERQQNGGYRFNIQSKRTSGSCMVDRAGNVYRLNTQ